MTNDMPVLDAMAASVRNEVYILVDGIEAMILTGCRTAAGANLKVEFADGSSDWKIVPADSMIQVTRVVS